MQGSIKLHDLERDSDPKTQALLQAVLELPEADRVEFAKEFLATLTSEGQDGDDLTEASWQRLREDAKNDPSLRKLFFPTHDEHMESLRVAIEEMREGKGVPVEEVLAEVREILNEGRSELVKIR